MRWRIGVSAVVAGSALVSARPALTQTPPQAPITDPSLGITVTATRLDEARSSIQPSLGATTYGFTPRTIDNVPLGENAPLNQVLLRAPGVVQDSFGQIHVRGDMGNVQYRLDGVQLPEGLSLFNNILMTRYAKQLSLLTGALPAQLAGTAAFPDVTQNDPVRAERADYFDAGVTVKPVPGLTLGLGAYYKIVQNMLDFGQFGAPIALTSFNYADGIVKGVEFNASYDEGPWSAYFNGAFGNGIGRNINSAQFSFGAAELAYIARNYIILDHTQGWTFSTGAAYTFNADTDWATKVSTDILFGSGLRTTVVTPNDRRHEERTRGYARRAPKSLRQPAPESLIDVSSVVS